MLKSLLKYTFFIFLIYSCSSEKKEIISENIRVEENTIELTEENKFQQFLTQFSEDTTFQKSHIRFPLKYDVVVKDQLKLLTIEKEDWLVVDLSSESEVEPMERKITVENDTAKVEFIGVLTKTFNGYLFTKDSLGWKLEMFSDYSK